MTYLIDQYPDVSKFLDDYLNEQSFSVLHSLAASESDKAMAAWLDSIGADGFLEIGSQFSRAGKPVIGYFPGKRRSKGYLYLGIPEIFPAFQQLAVISWKLFR